MKTLSFIILVHSCLHRFNLLKRTVYSLKHQIKLDDWEYKYKAICDRKTEFFVKKYLLKQKFEILNGPESQFDKWQMMFDIHQSDKFAICHSDDEWMPEKTKMQLLIQNPIVISAYIVRGRNYYTTNTPKFGKKSSYLTYCIMSGWMIDKSVKFNQTIKYKFDYGVEHGILSNLSINYDIGVVLNPLFVYNLHKYQVTNFINTSEKDFNLFVELYKKFIKGHQQLIYFYFLDCWENKIIWKETMNPNWIF